MKHLLFILCLVLSFANNIYAETCNEFENNEYFIFASKYYYYDKVLVSGDFSGVCVGFLDCINMRQEALKDLVKSNPPTEQEIIFFLRSKDMDCVSIGLINVMFNEIESKGILDELVILQSNENNSKIISYINLSLRHFKADDLDLYKEEIVGNIEDMSMVRKEELITAIPVLLKFETEEVFPLYMTLLRRNDFVINLAVVKNFKEIEGTLRVKLKE